ncbi:serine hydrolase [Lactococcus hodotermopsidis]|uniref:Serine hydrolase n=2 Tax=Pseudolactococcus hodotermopsidis TaxID=2709157 RepID=A0A6A0BCB6_9LACT|nr:serine hydrolase [Lactococcus hodotermopsidis]
MVKAYIASGIFPGASFAIVNGSEIEKYVIGNDSLKPEIRPLQPDMAYDLASVSKVVGTGTVVINLIFSGKLALDALLTDYYPDFEGGQVTIRQLLTHTSGVDPFIKNRNRLAYDQLRVALNQVKITDDKSFHYSDVNFILLGFMLETIFQQDLDVILQTQVFQPFGMTRTSFTAPKQTVRTAWELPRGVVHDPKAQVLGVHTGSAGLFSDLDDLVRFCQAYFSDTRYLKLLQNYAQADDMPRSLAWDILDETSENGVQWLIHTGYTGTFLMINLVTKQAVIFLSNRVHLHDDRLQWLKNRNLLIKLFVNLMKIV